MQRRRIISFLSKFCMRRLTNILLNIRPINVSGSLTRMVNDIHFDSRKVKQGDVFVAIRGTQVDGHTYIEKATQLGASVIVCEVLPKGLTPNKENISTAQDDESVTYVQIEDSAKALGEIAANYYDHPSQKLKLVGVTGTNGKTTTTTLLYDLFTNLGYKVGLISTIENKIGTNIIPATHTTPDAVALQSLINDMADAGCEYVFMEVSSHAIHQERIAGLTFAGGLFTNITHDHLDYHKTFRDYIGAKKKFFDNLPKDAFALTNLDDKRGMIMMQNTKAHVFRYSLRQLADFKAKILENTLIGLHLDLDGEEFFGRLIGKFNAYNLLSCYAVARLLGQEKLEVMAALSALKPAEGRFDYSIEPTKNIIGIVDYAHTPDALEKVLQTINALREETGKIITVVGCGGDRDKTKRPEMAKIACDYSQQVILTSDNPRTEDPNKILEDMEAGVPKYATSKTLTISNRKQAIKTAVQLAQKNDIILIAGKGHEKYQEINGVRHDFDDKAILREFFA